MDTKQFIIDKNLEIKKAGDDFEAIRQRLAEELNQATQTRDTLIAELSKQRDEAALAEKLSQFPAELVQNHLTCSVCGEKMRPFEFMEDGTRVKAWACAVGSLQPNHDLIRITT